MSDIGGVSASSTNTYQRGLPSSIDGVVDAVREILLKGRVQSLSMKVGGAIVYERMAAKDEEVDPSESTSSFAELEPLDVVRNVPMSEFELKEDGSEGATDVLLTMYHALELDQLCVTHLIVSEDTLLWDWIGVNSRIAKRLKMFLGARVVPVQGLPPEVFLACGSAHRNATLAETKMTLKCAVPFEVEDDEQAEQEGN